MTVVATCLSKCGGCSIRIFKPRWGRFTFKVAGEFKLRLQAWQREISNDISDFPLLYCSDSYQDAFFAPFLFRGFSGLSSHFPAIPRTSKRNQGSTCWWLGYCGVHFLLRFLLLHRQGIARKFRRKVCHAQWVRCIRMRLSPFKKKNLFFLQQ